MEKKLLGILIVLTFLSFAFPVLGRITFWPIAAIILLFTLMGFAQIGKILLFTFKPSKEKSDGNETRSKGES